ncbi:MAG: hypothetical protein ACP5GI_08160 [Sulfolobales archaeon]
MVKGGVIKSEYVYWRREKATLQSIRDILGNLGLNTWIKYHRLIQRVEAKAHRRLKHLYRTAIRSLAEMFWVFGVSEVYMG